MIKLINFIFQIRFFLHLKKIVRNIPESISILNKYVIDIKIINNAYLEIFHFPSNFPIYFRRNHPFFDTYLFKVKNVCVDSKSGLIYTVDKKYLFQESYGSLRKMFSWDKISSLKICKNIIKENNVYFIPYKSFFHFLLEELPALLYAKELYPNLSVIINNLNKNDYYKQSINLIIGKKDILYVKECFKSDSLIFTQHTNYSGFISKYDILILNKYFSKYFNQIESFEKIYISRSKIKRRAIANEKDLEIYLKKIGYKIIFLEDFSFVEQIQIVSNASFVIAPHGAGLSHLCWQNKRKNVIEIFISNVYNDCFARLSVMQDFIYNFVKCGRKNNKEYISIEDIIKYI